MDSEMIEGSNLSFPACRDIRAQFGDEVMVLYYIILKCLTGSFCSK